MVVNLLQIAINMGILQHIQHQISAVNDLIKINNDRIAGYEKAIDGTTDADLKELFPEFIEQSKKYVSDLNEHMHYLGGDPAAGTTLSGKVYHTWIDVKATFTGKDRHSILSDCEYGEDVAKSAYRKASDDKELIWEDDKIASILADHLEGLKTAHDTVKLLRDAAVKA